MKVYDIPYSDRKLLGFNTHFPHVEKFFQDVNINIENAYWGW